MKVSKLLVMAIVILTVMSVALTVNAATKADLVNYVTNAQTINGMKFELSNSQKNSIKDYLNSASVSDSQADVAYQKIQAAKTAVENSKVTSVDKLSADVKSQVISLAKDAAKAVGLTLEVNTVDDTFTLKKADGTVVTSGAVKSNLSSATTSSTSTSTSTSSTNTTSTTNNNTKKLLYTGSDYAVYAGIVAVVAGAAYVIRKRA